MTASLGLLALTACQGTTPSESSRITAARSDPLSLRVEYSGCREVLRGPVCILPDDRRLRLWIGTKPDADVACDGGSLVERVEVQGGRRVELEVAERASELRVAARRGAEGAIWRLAVGRYELPEWAEEARRLTASGDLEGAHRLAGMRVGSMSPADRCLALERLARLAQRTQPDQWIQASLDAARNCREAGLDTTAVMQATNGVFGLIERRDFSAARGVLKDLRVPEGDAEATWFRLYYEGLLTSDTSDFRTARRKFIEASDLAGRLGLFERFTIFIQQEQAAILRRFGRFGEAAEIFAKAAAAALRSLNDCELGRFHNDRAWTLLLAAEGKRPIGDPEALLHRALEIFDQRCDSFPEERLNVRLNLALARLQDDESEVARKWLDEARQLGIEPQGDVLLWMWDIEARILLAASEAASAHELYDRLIVRARDSLSAEAEWRATFGRGRSNEALDDIAAALSDYARAEELLDEEILLVPMDEGRGAFVGQREWATRRHLALLVERGLYAEAFALIREARSRPLRSLRRFVGLAELPERDREVWERTVSTYLAQRADVERTLAGAWQLSAQELKPVLAEQVGRLRELRSELDALLARLDGDQGEAPPALPSGEFALAFHPLPDGWVAVGRDHRGAVAQHLELRDELPQSEQLSDHLLSPFADRIRLASQMRVLAYGPLGEVDFHALPFDDDLLLAAKPVVYGMDLRSHPAGVPKPARALVVGDPEGNLPSARIEARQVAAALRADAWQVEMLMGQETAGRRIRDLLADSSLFHYAGHAQFDGWESILPLADDGRLTVDDVLALGRAPERVVLSGCETGRTSADVPAPTIGLAQAFLAAGSRSVVAAVRPVPDHDAAALVGLFYEALANGASVGESLRRAQLELRARESSDAWKSFRVIVP